MKTNRQGTVLFKGVLAGTIAETEEGYSFTYNAQYLGRSDASAISVTLPLREEPYRSATMLPFFDGLIPEGWLLAVVVKNWKIDQRDRMGLLLTVCKDCIGAVGVEALDE